MEALLLSVAGCMGIDVLMILEKGRVPVDELVVEVGGERAEGQPRRFTSLRLDYRIRGPDEGDEDRIQRAIDLSRDTYCSVLHTLRPDLELEITFHRV
jgi:putative redox protein